MERDEVRYESHGLDTDYDVLVVAYGTVARVCLTALEELAEEGVDVAMVRPVSLFPYPSAAVREAAAKAETVLVVELSMGQMIEDVRLAVGRSKPIHFLNRVGGMLISPDAVVDKIRAIKDGSSEEVPNA